MSYGIEIKAPNGETAFELSSRLTALIYSNVVGRNSSGSVTLNIPGTMQVTIQAIPLDGDASMRHMPHKITYDSAARRLHWQPAAQDMQDLAAWASPRRSRSRILVFGYMPE